MFLFRLRHLYVRCFTKEDINHTRGAFGNLKRKKVVQLG